jgi:hypothetical protein
MHAMVPDFFVMYPRRLTLKLGTVMLLLQKIPAKLFTFVWILLANNSFFTFGWILLASMAACIFEII